MEKLFDFTQPNLQDVQIENNLNQYIELSVGYRIQPLSITKISGMCISLESFKEILPKSALPAFIRSGSVKLTPLFSTISILAPSKATPISAPVAEQEELIKEEPPVVEENPFGHHVSKTPDLTKEPSVKDEPAINVAPITTPNNTSKGNVKKAVK